MLMLTTFLRLAALSRSRMPSWPQHVTVPLRRTAHVRPREAAMRLSPLRGAPRKNTGPRTTVARSVSGLPTPGSPGPGLGENPRTGPLPTPEPVSALPVAFGPAAGPRSSAPAFGPSSPAPTSPAGITSVASPTQRSPATRARRVRRRGQSRSVQLRGPGCPGTSVVPPGDHRCEATTTSDGSSPLAAGVAAGAHPSSPPLVSEPARGTTCRSGGRQRLQLFQLTLLSILPRTAGLKSVPIV